MRAIGLIGLVLALVIVGFLAKKQMGGIAAPVMPANPAATSATPPADARLQSQQIQQQFKQSLDTATQPRPMPDDAR